MDNPDLVVGEMTTGTIVRKGILNRRTGVFHVLTGDDAADERVWREASKPLPIR